MKNPLIFFGTAVDKNLKKDILEASSPELIEGRGNFKQFGDGEIFWSSGEDTRNKKVYIVQPTVAPGDNIIELGIMIDSLFRASASEITLVIPCYGYARQDHKTKPREPISAKMIAEWISNPVKTKRIVLLDAHSTTLMGFFDCVSDHLTTTLLMAQYMEEHMRQNGLSPNDIVIVAPDAGAGDRARKLSNILKCLNTVASKDRDYNRSDVINGVQLNSKYIEQKTVFICDDIGSSLSTLVETAKTAKEYGAKKIIAAAVHGFFIGDAMEKLNKSPIDIMVTTNSTNIPAKLKNKTDKMLILSVGPLLGTAIKHIHKGNSVSSLFEKRLPLKIY